MKRLSFIAIIVAAVLWGTSGLFVHGLKAYFEPLEMVAIRATLAALCILIYALLFNRSLFKVSLKMLIFFIFSGITFYGAAACYYAAMPITSVSTAAVLMYTAPVMVMIYSVAFMGEKFTPVKMLSVALMLVGCCFVSGLVGGAVFNPLGVAIALLAGVCYAAYSVLSKIEMSKGANPLSATIYSASFMAISALAVANPVNIVNTFSTIPSDNLFAVILMSIGLGLCTFTLPAALFNIGMKNLPAGVGSALSIIEPMSATVFGMIFLSEIPTVIAFVGIFMIMGAVFLLSRDGDETKIESENAEKEEVNI